MKHYFTTSGRCGRIEYITLTILLPFLAGTIHWFLQIFSSDIIPLNIVLVIVTILWWLALCWIGFTMVLHRMHDLGLSGWWLVLLFTLSFVLFGIGLVFPLLLLLGGGKMVLCFCPGDKKQNKFGPVPDMFGGFLAEETSRPSKTVKTVNGRIDFKL